jgi:hypothetical protein
VKEEEEGRGEGFGSSYSFVCKPFLLLLLLRRPLEALDEKVTLSELGF